MLRFRLFKPMMYVYLSDIFVYMVKKHSQFESSGFMDFSSTFKTCLYNVGHSDKRRHIQKENV